MLDVAQEAGVSSTTVSYVLNGQDATIPQQTRERVLAVAEKMGYRANRMAQQLARQDSGIVGLLVPNIEAPFFAALTTQLNSLTSSIGYRLMFEIVDAGPIEDDDAVLHAREQTAVLRGIDQLLEWNTAGLLFWLHRQIDREKLRSSIRGVPTVGIGVDTSFGREEHAICDYVYVNQYWGTRPAVEHLIALGHHRFCFVAPLKSLIDARQQAVHDALADAGLPPPQIVESELQQTPDRIKEIAQARDRPTAYLCVDDHQALATYSGLRGMGLRIPEDVSLVSCDGGLIANSLVPRLSSVILPINEIAQSAVGLLRDRLDSDPSAPARCLEVKPHFEARQSTAPPGV